MKNDSRIGIGVIGLGFIGRTHLRAFQNAARDGYPCQVRALCDSDPKRVRDQSGIGAIHLYSDVNPMLADPDIHLISVCTYTDTHVDFAMRALTAGKHVLVEKPVAISSIDVRRLANAANQVKTLCMPAMCMRFWPEWVWLRQRIKDGTFGRVRSAAFKRMGSRPGWGEDFYADYRRSGGALFDLHIHDADFIYWCFGKPESVITRGSLEHLTTLYGYPNGPAHISAEAAWNLAPTAAFRIQYEIIFEHATAEFDSRNDPLLIVHHKSSEAVKPSTLDAYDIQTRYIIDAVIQNQRDLTATLDDAVLVTEFLEAERTSMEHGSLVKLA